MSSECVERMHDSIIERYDKMMPRKHWRRNKKYTVDLLHDSPFAIERQLEDQRFQAEKNRNPQYYELQKNDKLRSYTIAAPKGAARSVAVKANVINKVVREASGVHNYTIIPPPRSLSQNDEKDLMKSEFSDPSTNVRVKVYANEAKMKPKLCSFGHRPRSASRTFHPATMKVRLKHGEILKASEGSPSKGNKSTGVGLSVAVLSKVLKAPKISGTIELGEGSSVVNLQESLDGSGTGGAHGDNNAPDYSDLFFSSKEKEDMFGGGAGRARHGQDDERSQKSWVSSVANSQQPKLQPLKTKNRGSNIAKTKNPLDDRPHWDTAHHMGGMYTNAEIFKLKTGGLNEIAAMSMQERIGRFKTLAAGTSIVPFCSGKQILERRELAGEKLCVVAPTPMPGTELYYDPNNVHVDILKQNRKRIENKKLAKIKAKEYQELLQTIPIVEYHPTTRLKQMKSMSASGVYSSGASDLGMGETAASGMAKQRKAKRGKGKDVPAGEDIMFELSMDRAAGRYESESGRPQQHDQGREMTFSPYMESIHGQKHQQQQRKHKQNKHHPAERDVDASERQYYGVGAAGFRSDYGGGEGSQEHLGTWQGGEEDRDAGDWHVEDLEGGLKEAMRAARRGDTDALFDYTIRSHLESQGSNSEYEDGG